MNIQNVEFKAKVEFLDFYEQKLIDLNAILIGTQQQLDTYFNSPKARLKLREVGDQSSLIHYDRVNTNSAKESEIIFYQHLPNPALKSILATQLGIKIIVDKTRKIYAIDNVRFHLDTVQQLGCYIEVEAMNENQQYSTEELKNQCDYYFKYFELDQNQLISMSYSDLVIAKNS